MSKSKIAEMSDQELLKHQKNLKMVTSTLMGMVAVLMVLTIVMIIIKGFSAFSVVPVALLPIVILNLNSLKEVKAEMISRNL